MRTPSIAWVRTIGTAVGALAVLCAAAHGKEKPYPVSAIPAELKKDAHAVVREYSEILEVRKNFQARYTLRKVVTIFDKQGAVNGSIAAYYDKFDKVTDLDGEIQDEKGEKIESLDKDRIVDLPAAESFSLYEDSRVKRTGMVRSVYPYTVILQYEIEHKGYMQWPSWFAQPSDEPVEHSRLEVILPAGDSLRYWTNEGSARPEVTTEDDQVHYVWSRASMPGLTPEELEEEITARTLVVITAPTRFRLEDFEGDMRTWREFGTWSYSLWHGRDTLPPSAHADMQALVKPTDTPRAKVAKVYKYMQARSRYVNVALGIGGWQPFNATYVHDRRYGDCKALTNYTVALLKDVGITAYPALIHSGGYDPLYLESFPHNQFNHVVACVPLGGDTIWLECTSRAQPAGAPLSSIENRFAMLITPEGGVVVHTPCTTARDNIQRQMTRARLAYDGQTTAVIRTRLTGTLQEDARRELFDATAEDRQHWAMDNLGISNAQVEGVAVDSLAANDHEVRITTTIAVPRYGTRAGGRIFFEPNLAQKSTYVPRNNPTRKSPVHLRHPQMDIDTACFVIPQGFVVEGLPKEIRFSSAIGSYHAKTIALGDSLIQYTREVEFPERVIPASNYGEYRKFWADVLKADKAQAVLTRKDQ